MKALIAIGTALCMALALSAAHNLDQDEAQAEASHQQAQKEQTAFARFERAAQAICGQNAAWRVDGITLSCSTKRGFTTQQVAIR